VTARLIIRNADGERVVACEPVMTLGRDRNSTIVLPEKLVSRNHAMIRRLGAEDYYLIDVGSSNGSYVNDRRIATPQQLRHGDEIRIGSTVLRFEQESAAAGPGPPPDDERTTLATVDDIALITVLVADIRGYTGLSERVPIGILTKLMAQWFRAVSDHIEANGGVVDKFIGDCVYARWDDEGSLPDTVLSCLRAAAAIRESTRELVAAHLDGEATPDIGVGINTGHAAVGIGTDNTALGDAVNLAFRLETASKELGRDVVLSRSACLGLPEEAWRPRAARIRVKGKREPVEVGAFTWEEVHHLLREEGLEDTVTRPA